VGIDVVDSTGKDALRLTMSIFKADSQSGDIGDACGQHVGLDSNITEVIATLQSADGKAIAGPERFRVNENILVGAAAFSSSAPGANEFTPNTKDQNFRRSELDAEAARLAKMIVQYFFGKKK